MRLEQGFMILCFYYGYFGTLFEVLQSWRDRHAITGKIRNLFILSERKARSKLSIEGTAQYSESNNNRDSESHFFFKIHLGTHRPEVEL